ncbi:MAG: hypothetical protein ACHQFW_06850, partial [Chitinophagales bacterium]
FMETSPLILIGTIGTYIALYFFLFRKGGLKNPYVNLLLLVAASIFLGYTISLISDATQWYTYLLCMMFVFILFNLTRKLRVIVGK